MYLAFSIDLASPTAHQRLKESVHSYPLICFSFWFSFLFFSFLSLLFFSSSFFFAHGGRDKYKYKYEKETTSRWTWDRIYLAMYSSTYVPLCARHWPLSRKKGARLREARRRKKIREDQSRRACCLSLV